MKGQHAMSRTLGECRAEAIKKRDAAIDAINERYDAECREEDHLFDAEFDRAREEFECVRKRPRSPYDVARSGRDEDLAKAERQMDADLKALFLQHGVSGNRYN
jgi:hypothetical protein